MIIKKKILLFSLVLLLFQISCEKSNEPITGNIVINEIMSVNTTIVADQDGEYDDWFELFNLSARNEDISGYYLSDNNSRKMKWKIPLGTTIEGNGYLIVWADKDSTQSGLHTNFKLSAEGEEVLFSKPDGTLIDEVAYPAQTAELSYSRVPDGTGTFKWQNPTFNTANSISK